MNRIVAIISIFFALLLLSGCADKKWTYTKRIENDGTVITSQDGEDFYFSLYDFYISGFKKGSKVGVLGSENSAKTSTLYLADGDDSGKYLIEFSDITPFEKYFPSGLDGHCSCHIYVKSGEKWEYNYKDANISSVAFIPYDDISGNKDFDYAKYVNKHGIYNDEAKAVMETTLSSPLEYSSYDDIAAKYIVSHNLGRLVYYLDGVDWFCFDAEVRYHSVYGFYISYYGWYGSDNYLLSEDNAKVLGIDISVIDG